MSDYSGLTVLIAQDRRPVVYLSLALNHPKTLQEDTMIRKKLPNSWRLPAEDPRSPGLLEISWAISDSHDLASGLQDIVRERELNPEIYPFWTPLRLADAMEKEARRIREATQDSSLQLLKNAFGNEWG
jgi:hypothetical protein